MSGLVALVGDGATRVAIDQMLRAAPNRGHRLAFAEAPGIALGTQITDSAHPFVSVGIHADERFFAAAAGCLYNGRAIVTGDDVARRIAGAYASRGHPGVAALRGSYAAVVFDTTSQTTFAVRSHVSERPLFWRENGATIAFASEVKQLLAAPHGTPTIDRDVLLDLVAARLDDLVRTPFRGVKRLLSGRWLEHTADCLQQGAIWDPRSRVGRNAISFADAVEEFRSLLTTAVERRFGASVAVLMSGGLDSTTVAAAAAPLHRERFGRPLRTASALFPEHSAADETTYIRATVDALGVDPLWVRPRPRPFRKVAAHARLQDGPSIAPLPCIYMELLGSARGAGCTAVLDGQDGDSLFGSYRLLIPALVRARAARAIKRIVAQTRSRERVGWARASWIVLGPWAVRAFASARARATGRRLNTVSPVPLPPWATAPLADRVGMPQPESWADEQAWMYGGPLDLLLELHERIALTSGVSLLHPLSDADLVEFFLGLPPTVKFATGQSKSIARRAMSELPAQVRERPDKAHFDEVVCAAARRDDVLNALAQTPRRLPGIDWDRLEQAVRDGAVPSMVGPAPSLEVRLLLEALHADYLLAA